VNNTAELLPVIPHVQYPKAGEKNSAARAGVVSVEGGPTTWFKVPGDPRNHYIARMEWAANSTAVVIQQLNRLQNANSIYLGNVRTGDVRSLFVERDDAWVDLHEESLHWLDDGKQFTWVSERDGWRHLYVVSRDGGTVRRITSGPFDIIRVEAVDARQGYAYYSAAPDNAAQRYLYRISLRLEGAQPELLTPK